MTKVRPALKRWLAGHYGVDENADDETFHSLFRRAIENFELTTRKYAELVEADLAERPPPWKTAFPVGGGLREHVIKCLDLPGDVDAETVRRGVCEMFAAGQLSVDKAVELTTGRSGPCAPAWYQKEIDAAVDRGVEYVLGNNPLPEVFHNSQKDTNMSISANQLLASSANQGGERIRVKDCAESYSTKRATGLHVKTGQPVCPDFMQGKAVETSSAWDTVRAGVLLKYSAMRAGLSVGWSEHDANIMAEMIERDEWCGRVGNEWQRGLRGNRVKALLSESGTSGGLALNPVAFDEAVIVKPLLTSELFPFVEVLDVPRGSTIEGAAIGTPTVHWGTAEGTAEDLFDTSGLVSPLSHSIFPIQVFVEVGRDLLADAAVDVGKILVAAIGERFAAEFDRVIAVGNATTEPEGIFTASAGNTIPSQNGTAGPIDLAGDLLALSMGIGKQYRTPAMAPAFVMADVTYRRARSIPTAQNWNTLALGNGVSAYQLLEWPAKIQNDIPESSLAFMPLRKYRMYRRAGLEMRWTDQGMTLAKSNTALLCCRARYGGFVTDTDALAVMLDGPATG